MALKVGQRIKFRPIMDCACGDHAFFALTKGYMKGTKPHRGKWCARIGGKHIGIYDTEQAAHEAFLSAAVAKYGQFARAE